MIAAEVIELERWADKALALNAELLDDEALIGTVEAVARLSTKIDALRARLANAVDNSEVWARCEHGNPTALLRSLSPNHHPGAASSAVRLGDRLRQMPHAATAFAAGSITANHVRLLGECLHPRFDGQFNAFEEELVRHAAELPFTDFQRLVAAWKSWADDAVDADRDLKDARAREVHLSRTLHHRGVLKGTLAPLARSIVDKELRRLEQQLFEADWADAVARHGEANTTKEQLRRSPAQRRHDALVWMAMRSAVADEGALPEAMVYVHTTTTEVEEAIAAQAPGGPLAAPARERYDQRRRELDDRSPISRQTLARLSVRARLRRVVFDGSGEIVDAGRTRRFFSPLQRELVATRDRVCACGCSLPARDCEIDHIVEWRDGGPTDLSNAQPLCPSAHRKKANSPRRGSPF